MWGLLLSYNSSSTSKQPVLSSHRSVLRARLLADQRLVNVRNDATTSDRSLDQAVQFLLDGKGGKRQDMKELTRDSKVERKNRQWKGIQIESTEDNN